MRQFFCTLTGFILLNLIPSSALAQTVFATPEDMQTSQRLDMITRTLAVKAGEMPGDNWNWSSWAQAVSMAGREDLLRTAPVNGQGPGSHQCASGDEQNAIESLVSLAKQHSLIIINEDHAKPGHRVFIWELATRLRTLGFTHYAAETFTLGIVDGTGYPKLGDGPFTREPMMSRLIEDIRRQGYKLIPYEARMDQFDPFDSDPRRQMDAREEAQAQNLMDSVLSADPQTKIIVHVGHGHNQELMVQDPNFIPMMAARLKQKSGLDPLTIDLTQCEMSGEIPVLTSRAKSEDGPVLPNFTDYRVRFPPLEFQRGRPDYRLNIGDRFVEIPEELWSGDTVVLIEARPPGAPMDQRPIERLVLAPGEDIPLLLPPGDWALTAFDQSGTAIKTVSISVPEI